MQREGSSKLAAAIIKAALEDRKDYMEKLKLNPESIAILTELEQLDAFFEGELFELYCALCNMDPEYIREYLKENNCDEQRILAKSLQDRQKAQIKENQVACASGTGSRNKSKTVGHAKKHKPTVKDGRTGGKDNRPEGKHPGRRKPAVQHKS